MLSIHFNNGTYTSFEYNGANQLVSQTNYNVGGVVGERFTNSYDKNGNIVSIQTTKGTINYQYDPLNKLTQETLQDGTRISYEYDSVGNRTKKTVTKGTNSTITNYSYDQAYQLISVDNQTYVYDPNGNLVDGGKNTFVYNPENQLTEVKEKATGKTTSFTYDHQGRRKTTTTSSGTVTFHYDQKDNVVFETDQNGNILAEYTWDQENRPVTMVKNGLTYYYHLNGHGDVVALTDKDGNNVASYTYDAWGNILSQSGTMHSTNPYRFAGYRYDENTKLYYLMARYYDPETGQFISRDPSSGKLENPVTQNEYTYANNNPIMLIDPNGKVAFYVTRKQFSTPLKAMLVFLWPASFIKPKALVSKSLAKRSRKVILEQIIAAEKKAKLGQLEGITRKVFNAVLIIAGIDLVDELAKWMDRSDGKYDNRIKINVYIIGAYKWF
ncbi:MAG TPA: hypothetical protein GXX18_05670 [Bacillales bacterium]|nr:hypothetical protein [Bacillales bacterium]